MYKRFSFISCSFFSEVAEKRAKAASMNKGKKEAQLN